MKALCLLFLSLLLSSAKQPNILLILADDMGYADMGCMGSQVLKTPHLDALAKNGVLCTQGYVPSSVCSPSRAGILTGRDPRRFGYEGNLNKGPDAYPTRPGLQGLPPSEHTLADHLKSAGYATALIGKWHQGMSAPFHPNVRGFDHFLGMLSGSHTFFPKPDKNKLEENGKPLTSFSTPYITDYFTDECLKWIQSKEEQPWFLFASYNAPHTPMEATDEDIALFPQIENPKRRIYAAMMYALDRSVGRLVKQLRESGELENTLIVFFSDNGGATNNASWNGPLAGRKGTLAEGGVRVPFIFSWPGTLPSGKTQTQPISALDLLPTFMKVAGKKPLPLKKAPAYEDRRNRNAGPAYDGVNILPVLKGELQTEPRLLTWRLQGQSAILYGEYKLIRFTHRPAQLFSPAKDPGEANDLSSHQNEVFRDLFSRLGTWESRLATQPLWDSSPRWWAESAKNYDTARPIEEPQ
ncbi:sulfatase-like hydrolase/transferase [Akkermansiaceae bacterium]|nr:sulfatase-like hydrolase/transferase [Akkermansiaceae bacterium]